MCTMPRSFNRLFSNSSALLLFNTISERPMLSVCTHKGKLMLHKSFSNIYAPYKYSQLSKEELDTRTYRLWGYFDYWDFRVGR